MARRNRRSKISCCTGEIVNSYNDYLKTIHWKCKRAYIYTKRNKRCEKCNKPLTRYSVHHLTYKNIGFEKDEDLMLLCEKCHMELHYGSKKKSKAKRTKEEVKLSGKEKVIQTKNGKLEYANPKLNKK